MLTKEQRLEVYKVAAEYYMIRSEGGCVSGFCCILPDYANYALECCPKIAYGDIDKFPEVLAYKPPISAMFEGWWFGKDFDGALQRLSILLVIINEMENGIN